MQLIDKEIDLELSEHICGWHEFEGKIKGEDIIDMNLSGNIIKKIPYKNRRQILSDVERFLLLKEIENHPQIYSKLKAHHYVLRSLEGDHLPFTEYYTNVIGHEPTLFSEKRIQTIKEQAIQNLAVLNIKFDANAEASFIELEQKNYPKDVHKYFAQEHEKFYNNIDATLNLNQDFKINYSSLSDDSNFLAWITGDGKNYSVAINPSKDKKFSASKFKLVALHELTAHAVQFSIIRQKIEANEIPKYLGYITTHEPVQFSAEGLATTLYSFYPEEAGNDQYLKATDSLMRLSYALMNNSALMFYDGADFEDCVSYSMNNHVSSELDIRKRLSMLRGHQVSGQDYNFIYGIAKETFQDVLNTCPDKNKFINDVYRNFLMPNDIKSYLLHPVI